MQKPQIIYVLCLVVGATGILASETQEGPSYEAVVLQTYADSTDLKISVHWADNNFGTASWGELHLANASGEIVSTAIALKEPGTKTQHILPGGLDRTPHDGFQYSVSLIGPDGEMLAPEHQLRITLSCDQSEECRYATIDGFVTDGVAISHDLLELIDEFADSTDLFSFTVANAPHLRGETFALAAQLYRLGPDETDPHPCHCLWFATHTTQPTEQTVDTTGDVDPGYDEYAAQGPGAQLRAGSQVQAVGIPDNPDDMHRRFVSVAGASEIGMHRRCYEVVQWLPIESWNDLPENWFALNPILKPCTEDCSDESVEADASAWAAMRGTVWTPPVINGNVAYESSGSSHAATTADLSFPTIGTLRNWVNEPLSIIRSSNDEVLPEDPNVCGDTLASYVSSESFSPPKTHFNEIFSGANADLRIDASGSVETSTIAADGPCDPCPLSPPGPWAIAEMTFDHAISLTAESSCAGAAFVRISTISPAPTESAVPQGENGCTEDGLLIERWHP